MKEIIVTLYLDTDEDSVVDAKLSQVLKYAHELGFRGRSEVILDEDEEEIDIPEGHMYNIPMGKIQRFISNWQHGRSEHYPICCVLRFAIEDALDDGKIRPIETGQAEKRGGFYRGSVEEDDVFVPCGIFHHSNHECPDDCTMHEIHLED
jgi:hypothetical protein